MHHQRPPERRKEAINAPGNGVGAGLAQGVRESVPHPGALTMADLAFVVATIAVFALVALVAKGVARL
ncbi:hypothetical protein [Streptomyces sp. NPDC052042]|uniref:hypothetical protein n=1 Tax=Streptomyces sp. NPDC052042 TaxID=3365683 RepID=UPI0037CE3E12